MWNLVPRACRRGKKLTVAIESRWQCVVVSRLACIGWSAAAMSTRIPALSQKMRKGRAPAFVCGEVWACPPKVAPKPLTNSMSSGVKYCARMI